MADSGHDPSSDGGRDDGGDDRDPAGNAEAVENDTDTATADPDTSPTASETSAETEPQLATTHAGESEPEPAADRPDGAEDGDTTAATEPPADVQTYSRFTKVDGARYERVNDFLRDRTHITAREWAIARLCADFRTETGVEMTKIGNHLPELVPFMTDTYSPQAVNQARASFEEKVRMAGATFLYGAMCDFFTAEELDDVIYEATETAKFLLEVEGVDLAVEEELAAEDRISDVMREVRAASEALRNGPVECPDCGHEFADEPLD